MTVIDWGEYNRPPYINAKRITNNGPEGVTYDEATQTLNISNVKLSPDSVDFKLIYFQYLTDADLTGLDISDTTTLSRCFEYSRLNSLNISNWNTENITDMEEMFIMASFPDGYILDLSSFNTKNVSETTGMFDSVRTTVYINPDTWTLTPEQTSGELCTFVEKRPVPPAEDLQTKIKKDIQSATQALATLTKTELGKCIKSSDVTDTIESGNMNPVTSNAVNGALANYNIDNSKFQNVDLNSIVGEVDRVKTYAILGDVGKNCPSGQNGYLTVYNSSTRSRITQTYKSNETYLIWERVSNDGGATWGDWQELATKSDLANYFNYFGCVRWTATETGRTVFYQMRDFGVLTTDSNGAKSYVIGNVNGIPFNNIYQMDGTRYLRDGDTIIGGVTWNDDNIINAEIRILYVKDIS